MTEIFTLVGRIAVDGWERLTAGLSMSEKEAQKLSVKMKRLGRDIEKTGKDLSKYITAPVLGLTAVVTKFGADFDRAMINSIAIMGDVSDTMRTDMEMAARSVAKTTKYSATQAAEAYYFLASAGLNAAQSIGALPRVAKFAQAGNFDLALATELLADAQSALGLKSADAAKNMENMTRVSDVLVKANTLANASVQQFSEALTNKGGASLRMLGKDLEEGAAVLAVYADQGLKGAGAGETLNIVLRDLQRASIENSAAFQRAGIQVFDSSGEMRNMADIVAQLETRMQGMSDKQKRVELSTLGFTDKSVSATVALLGTSGAIREYETKLRSAAGVTDEVAAKQLQNFWEQVGLIKDRVIDLGLTLWKAFSPILINVLIPAFDKLQAVLEPAVNWIAQLSQGNKEAILMIIGLTAALGPAIILIGKLVTVMKILPMLFTSLNAVMRANVIGIVITAVYALVTAGILLYKNWDKVKGFLLETWDTIVYGVSQAVSYIKQALFSYVLFFVKAYGTVAKYIPGLNKLVGSAEASLKALIEAEKESRYERKANREEAKLAAQRTKELEAAVAAAKEQTEALTEAEEEEQDTKFKGIQLTQEQIDAAKKLAEDRKKFEDDYLAKVREQTYTRTQLLEYEYQATMKEAERLGADKTQVEAYYANERLKIARDEAAKKKEYYIQVAEFFKSTLESGFAVAQMFTDNKLMLIDNETSKEKEDILKRSEERKADVEATIADEDAKNAAIRDIEEGTQAAIANAESKADVKKKALLRRQAIREKALGIFQIGLSTAIAVMKGFAELGPILGAIAMGATIALGVAQAAAIATKPLPLAEGALIKRRDGGVLAQIGEGSQDEAVLPMETGVKALVAGVLDGIKNAFKPSYEPPPGARPGLALAGAGGASGDVYAFNFYAPVIADDNGLKDLERRLYRIRIAEGQRKGHE